MPVHYEFEHDVESVFDCLTDPDFLVDRSLAMGELEASCDAERDVAGAVVKMTRKIRRDLPGFLAKMMGPVQVMHVTEQWRPDGEGGWAGEYAFEVEGQPVSIGADFELYPTEAGCCYSIEHRASARVPLVGRRIEKYILAQAVAGCTSELDYLRERLD